MCLYPDIHTIDCHGPCIVVVGTWYALNLKISFVCVKRFIHRTSVTAFHYLEPIIVLDLSGLKLFIVYLICCDNVLFFILIK